MGALALSSLMSDLCRITELLCQSLWCVPVARIETVPLRESYV
jgi:hypothetical protein